MPITPNYLELSVADLAAAKDFYNAALGFAFTDYGEEYAAVEGGPTEVGFAPTAADTEVAPPLPVFESDDLDAAHDAVEAAGGTIVTPPFDYPGGRRFHFRDPDGNELAVYQRA